MDASILIPIPDTIPVAWGWFQFLLMLTFVMHLLVMNAMLGSAVIALATHFRHPEGSPGLCRFTAHKLTYLIAFAVNLGVAPLLFLQVLYGQFLYTSSVLMAWHWLAVVGLLILAYSSAYIYHLKYKALGMGRVRVLWLVVIPLLVIAFIFTNNMTLMLNPRAWLHYFDQPGGTLLNLADPVLAPRFLHMLTGSVAIGGLFIALANHCQRQEEGPSNAQRVEAGLSWFCFATLVQIGIGVWFLVTLPSPIRTLFLGASALHTGLLALGIACGLAAVGFGFARKLLPAVIGAVATVTFMALVRDLVRRAYLAPYFAPGDLSLAPQPQYGLLTLFLVLLVGTMACVAYMLRLSARAGKEVRP
ncbi:MAG: hypothetical protein OEV91_06855 [Desulfobulbaceae bacterium]|nr:hypothetical protein [Desulfobulbaceae bacterium]